MLWSRKHSFPFPPILHKIQLCLEWVERGGVSTSSNITGKVPTLMASIVVNKVWIISLFGNSYSITNCILLIKQNHPHHSLFNKISHVRFVEKCSMYIQLAWLPVWKTSMELEFRGVPREIFHGIPWRIRTSTSMEISPWISMENISMED